MAEGRVPDVVEEARSFDHFGARSGAGEAILVGAVRQKRRHSLSDLRHLEGVRQPVVVDADLVGRDHLGSAGEGPELGGVNETVDVMLERRPVIHC